jgi:hypothetical protein
MWKRTKTARRTAAPRRKEPSEMDVRERTSKLA